MCNFTDIYGKHPEPFHWWLTGYPLMTLETGTWIRDLRVSIVLPHENVSQTTVPVYGKHGGPFTNTSEKKTINDNGTTTLLLTYSVPWSITRGNATVDVIVGSSRYKKIFLFDRHSSDFYAILTVLMIVTIVVSLAFISHRTRHRTDIPYRRNIE